MKDKWGIIAKDFNSPLTRNYIFTSAFLDYPKYIGISVLRCGVVSRDDQIEYLYIPQNWAACHQEIKAKILRDPGYLNLLIDKTNAWGEDMNHWSQKEIFKADLAKLSNSKLVRLLEEFFTRQARGYTYGTSIALIDFASFSFVDGNLHKILKRRVSGKEFEKYYKLFTTPLKNSYAQDQEEALLALIKKYYSDKSWLRDVGNKKLGEIKNKYPKFFEDLSKHAEKYAWVYYVYKGPVFRAEQFYEFIKDYLAKGVNPAQRLLKLNKNKKSLVVERKKAIKSLKLDKFEKMIVDYAPRIIWAKPRRKDYQSRSYYHVEKLLTEISKRLSISLNQARCLTPALLKAYFETGANEKELNSIRSFHICYPENGKVKILHGKAAKSFLKKVHYEKSKNIEMREFAGTCAFQGKANGKVKIIYRPEDMHKMQRGDILVSNATTPSIVHAMKMAAAIITDEGGLTCHAAIVSRELEIPCIIGTRIATEVLKDGDLVEVIANKGLVKILKKA